ncbi:ATP-dependent RNA helicase DHX8/PRP22 [Pancytospora philotis]|nr:ATP-dependent RNA helicase DHX8/PRP22 [Pancytospora philotis]
MMAEKESISAKIKSLIGDYVHNELGIKAMQFSQMLAHAFVNNDRNMLEGLLEPVHMKNLDLKLGALIEEYKSLDAAAAPAGKGRARVDRFAAYRKADSAANTPSCEGAAPASPSGKGRKAAPEGQSINALSDGELRDALTASGSDSRCATPDFKFEAVPEGLVAPVKPRREQAGLCSFIYQMDHAAECDKEETVDDKIDEVRKALAENQIVLVQGSTGCGKTTKIPRLLLGDYKRIVCTQPRRLAAINVARRVASEMEVPLGDLVGYSVRFDDKSSKRTRLKFVTDGILLKELAGLHARNRGGEEQKDKMKLKYDLVVIDEAHERSVNMDILMAYFKTMRNTKLLIMSATLDLKRFVDYFNCPFVEIKHRIHKIDHMYLKHQTANYVRAAVDTVTGIFDKYDEGNVLVFLTGQRDIEEAHALLSARIAPDAAKVLQLYAQMPAEDQMLVFEKGTRKVILSTNIAETSVTIDNIRFVVDCGRVKQMRRSHCSSVDILETVFISQSQAKQRAGRAGRTGPGFCFRLYTREEHDALEESLMPEIMLSNLNGVILSLKAFNINDIVNFDFIDRPNVRSIEYSLHFLYYLRAIDQNGRITPLGESLASLPLQPELAMALLSAKRLGCIDEVSTIAAFLNHAPVFVHLSNNPGLEKAKKSFEHPKGEFYTALEIYDQWAASKFSYSFLNKNFLKPHTMGQILTLKLQLMGLSASRGMGDAKKQARKLFKAEKPPRPEACIEKAFASGYFMNVARRTTSSYETIIDGTVCGIHPTDPLFKARPKFVLFYEIICTRREYMRTCLEIDAKILAEACNHS